MIVEMAGRPAAHLTQALEKHIGILNQVKDITVHSIKVSEPREIKVDPANDKATPEGMFTAFAEADFESESFSRLSETMFDFMPSSVEVIEPGKVSLDMNEATGLLNNISGRMHRYDEIAKIAGAKMQHMNGQLEIAQKIINERDAEVLKLREGVKKKPAKKKTKKAAGVKKTTKKKAAKKKAKK